MPGFTTHYLFGSDLFNLLPENPLKKNIRKNNKAYALGLQGPDIFFFYIPSHIFHKENLGSLAQDKKTGRFDVDSLIPTLNNHFMRITLVNSAKTERLTIDSDLCFNNLITGEYKDMGKLVIIELKRDGLCYSPVLEMLQELHIHPHGFSKYCMGSALTNSELKINRFKPNIIDINKIMAQAV